MFSSFLLRCLLAAALLTAASVSAQGPVPAPGIEYSGGDGSTIKKAIVISGAHNADEARSAELAWIGIHLPEAVVESRGRVTGPPHYDVLTVKLANGSRMDLHFDVTAADG